MDNKYQYRPLVGQSDVRLLRISSSGSDVLVFQLLNISLDASPDFEAVSYTWGSKIRNRTIQDQETQTLLYVTENCEAALRSVVNAASKDIWIDAVCIDQDNETERSQQVRLMGRIYRNACQTFAYIGEADRHTEALESWCEERRMQDALRSEQGLVAVRRLVEHGTSKKDAINAVTEWRRLRGDNRRAIDDVDDEDEGNEPIQELRQRPLTTAAIPARSPYVDRWHHPVLTTKYHAMRLHARPWFKRTWVIQEVLLSRTLTVLAGSSKIDWVAFYALAPGEGDVVDVHAHFRARVEGDSSGQYTSIRKNKPRLTRQRSSDALWHKQQRPEGISTLLSPNHLMDYGHLFQLMCETQSYACEDPRDKLFGLLSLFHGEIPAGLEPSYTRPLEDVYTNISRFCLCYGVAVALSAACGNHGDSSLPTWVVDWRDASAVSPFRKASEENVDPYSIDSCHAGFSGAERRILVKPLPGRGVSIRGLRVEKTAQIWSLTVHDIRSHSISSRRLQQIDPWVQRVYRNDGLWRQNRTDVLSVLSVLKKDEGIGFVPKATERGDYICIFLGFRVPFILRPTDNAWQLVGECYLPWLMEGQQVANIDWNQAYTKTPPTPLEDFFIY